MPPQIASARPGAAAGSFVRGSTGPFKPPRPRTVHRVDDDEDEDGGDDTGSPTDVATDNDDDHDGEVISKRPNVRGGRNTKDTAAAAAEDEDDAPTLPKSLPPALLARLMHHFFQNPAQKTRGQSQPTRMTQDAHAAIGKYMEIFVREAVARSVAERRGDGGGFLDVDVLQKVAGQLIMDM